jgi:hypothetical protein
MSFNMQKKTSSLPVPPPSMPSISVSKEDLEVNQQFESVLVCDYTLIDSCL